MAYRRSERIRAAPPRWRPRARPTNRARSGRRASTPASRKMHRRGAKSSRAGAAGEAARSGAAYRTRFPDRAYGRGASAARRPAAGFLRPRECRCGTGARQAAARRAAERERAAGSNVDYSNLMPADGQAQRRALHRGRGFREQAFQYAAEIRAVLRIGQREFDEALEVAREIADVVALLFGGKLHRDHAPALFAHELNRVGKLDLAAFIGFDAVDHVEEQRRKNVAAGNRQVARSLAGGGLFDHIQNSGNISRSFDLQDPVVRRLVRRHLSLVDEPAGSLGNETIRHAATRARDGVEPGDLYAQRHQKRLFAGEVFGA